MHFKKILVATDFSDSAAVALETAIALAKETGSALELLHVVEDPLPALAWSEVYAFDPGELRETLIQKAERALTDIQRVHATVPMTTCVAVGRPADTIVETAVAQHVDLIVVGSHGRTGLSRLFLGSVAERVVRHAPCAVLTVRPPAAKVAAGSTVSQEIIDMPVGVR